MTSVTSQRNEENSVVDNRSAAAGAARIGRSQAAQIVLVLALS